MKSTWKISETSFDISTNKLQETIFSQGNGYIGIRGNLEENGLPQDATLEGNYINGFYEIAPIYYEERKAGFAPQSETMLNVTAAKSITLTVEGEPFNMTQGVVLDHKRELDLKEGIVTRRTHWRSSNGREVVISSKRLVSLTDNHILAISYEVTPQNFSGRIEITTGVDGDVRNMTRDDDTRVGTNLSGQPLEVTSLTALENGAVIVQTTKESGLSLSCAVKVLIDNESKTSYSHTEKSYMITKEFYLQQGETLQISKFIAYACDRNHEKENLHNFTTELVEKAAKQGFDYFIDAQRNYLASFWKNADITIDGNDALQRSVRFGIFSLLQAAGHDGHSSIGAKGLSGEGYQGHYFWETETYMLPVFAFTCPEIARSLLMYRYSILNKARELAVGHALEGAMYPWRTISGAESSPYYPAGTAQYHITGGVAYATKLYWESSGDDDFIVNYGAEMLFETARMWLSLGHFNKRKGGKFCIDCVTGPDEYTTIVNNNCYTNISAAENMLTAADVYHKLEQEYPEKLAELSSQLNLTINEVKLWRNAAENIFLPYDEELGIYMQDDSFLDKKPWDFEAHKDKHLMQDFHPLQIYRAQVCKQADLILAELLFPQRFTDAQIAKDYDYYEAVTGHDSSLSECVFSMVAARIGKHAEAMKFFMGTAFMDIENTHKNTQDGLHMANMAGTWLCIIYGFAGFKFYNKKATFAPYLPDGWKSYKFSLCIGKCSLEVTVSEFETTYVLTEGTELTFMHYSEEYCIKNGIKVVVAIK
ncbi:MAG: glycoside hydrolase family 65 protein [Defluviitaleaceae bacterium]|nr:glycoside hydrolase family 65 protein [Defluviitaleaceae bacterium]